MTKLTISAKWIAAEAESIAREAKDNLDVWVVMGQTEKYGEAMRKVQALRDAAQINNLSERRAALQVMGYGA